MAGTTNRILSALPDNEFAELRPHLVLAPLVTRQVIHVRGHLVPDIVFIEQGIASLTVDTSDNGNDNEIEVGLIGREGLVGATVFLKSDAVVPHQAFVQVAGSAYRINITLFTALLERTPVLRTYCLGFLYRLMSQTAQVAGCNVRHAVTERLARWLLMTRDRLDSEELPMTHEFLSVMLGVRRAAVSLAASTLQNGGLIRQERGKIVILDHPGLTTASCNCYTVMKSLYDFEHPSVP